MVYASEKLQFPKSMRCTPAFDAPPPSYVIRMLDDQNLQLLYASLPRLERTSLTASRNSLTLAMIPSMMSVRNVSPL